MQFLTKVQAPIQRIDPQILSKCIKGLGKRIRASHIKDRSRLRMIRDELETLQNQL